MKIAIAFVASLSLCLGELPAGFKTCKRDDGGCLAGAIEGALGIIAGGVKPMGIIPIDPFHLPKVNIPGNGGSVDLEQHFNPLDLHGLSNSKISDVEVKLDGECSIKFTSLAAKVEMLGQHHLTGKMLIFQLNGFGAFNVTLDNLKIQHILKCETYAKDGEDYLKVRQYDVKLTADKVHYDFENVVDGNKQLSDEIVRVANENDQEIFGEIKDDHGRTYALAFKGVANKVFATTPVKQIFL